ncbi:nucleotidyltransferase domain-containing protein [Methanosarcinales archaeon]|nr:MAG: nucleotidyltransferase domain-containing protein [Methanosarcinales archaeon]
MMKTMVGGTKMDEIGTTLDEIVGKIANAFNPEKIIIFGSHAYGKPTEKSDIGILVIMESNKREIERIVAVSKLIREHHKKIDFNILVKTPAEVKYRSDIGDPVISEIISKGKVLAHQKITHKTTKPLIT